MGVRALVNKKRTQLALYFMSEGKGKVHIEIPEIPLERSPFLDSGDEWERVVFSEDADMSGCIYYAKKGNAFPSHVHHNCEHMTILNKRGKIKSFSEKTGTSIIEWPNSIVYEPGDWHAVKWLEDTRVLITWKPAFKNGWDADLEE